MKTTTNWEYESQRDYDLEFNGFGTKKYETDEILETTLENYPVDCVEIPDGKLFFSAKVPYTLKGSIFKGIIFANHKLIFYNLGINYAKLNPNRPSEWVYDYLEYINRKNTNHNYLSPEDLQGISQDILNDIDKLEPLYTKIKKWWIKPSIIDKKSAYNNRKKNSSGLSIENIIRNLPNRKVTMNELSKKSAYSSERTFLNSLSEDQKSIIKAHNKKYNKR